MRITVFLSGMVLLLAACGGGTLRDADEVSIGESLYTITFDEESPENFDTSNYANDAEDGAPAPQNVIQDGRYLLEVIDDSTTYIWGQGGEAAQNVAVEASFEVQSNYENNLYGVMCRLNDDGAGYTFLISSDGFAGIARTDGRSLSFLLDWVQHDGIAPDGVNTVQGVCVDDYLAIFVNGELVGDTENDLYPEAGEVGLMAGFFAQGREGGTINVLADDLTVTTASLE